MPQSSTIYQDTARDVINIRRQLADLLATPQPSSTPFLDYQQGQEQDQETQRTESELSRKRAMSQVFGQTRRPTLPEFQDAFLNYYHVQPANPGFQMPEFMKEQDPELAQIADENYLRWNLYQQALKDSETEYRQTWPGFWDRPLISEESMLKHQDNPAYQFLAWLGSDVTNNVPAMEEYKTGYQPGPTVMPWQLTPNEIRTAPETALLSLGILPAAYTPEAILAANAGLKTGMGAANLADAALNAGIGASTIADAYSKRNLMDPEQLWANYLLGGLAVAGGASQAASVLSRAGSTLLKGNQAASTVANTARQTAPAGRNGSIAEQMAARFSMAKAPERATGQMDIALLPGEARPTRSLSQFSPDDPDANIAWIGKTLPNKSQQPEIEVTPLLNPTSGYEGFNTGIDQLFQDMDDLQKLIETKRGTYYPRNIIQAAKPLENRIDKFWKIFDDTTVARSELDTLKNKWLGKGYTTTKYGENYNANRTTMFRMSVSDMHGHSGGKGPHANFFYKAKKLNTRQGEWRDFHVHFR